MHVKFPPWTAWVLLVIGPLLMFPGVYFIASAYSFSARSASTAGTVIAMSPGSTQSPTVEYFVDNCRFVHKSNVSSSPPRYSIGDAVELVYDPDDPQSAAINSFVQRWLLPLACVMGGFWTTVVGLVVRMLILKASHPAE